MKTLVAIIVVVVVLVALILGVRAKLQPSKPQYDVFLANRTHHDLEDVYIYFDNRLATGKGILIKGGRATHSYITLPVPAVADMQWVEQKATHAVKVTLEGLVPPEPRNMIVWFLIEEDGSVTVQYTGQHDEAAIGDLLRSLLPYRTNGETQQGTE